MRKSSLFCIVFVLFSLIVLAQKKDTIGLNNAARDLNTALVHKDGHALKRILSRDLSYGHSNGWTETRKALLKNLYNGKLSYAAIVPRSIKVSIEDNMGIVQSKGDYTVIMNEQFLQFKLNVLQVWKWKKNKWILMSRQSVQEQ